MKQDPWLLDVTLRDGGYVNDHTWRVDQATQIVDAVSAARIPYVEVGYLRPRRHRIDGDAAPAASCPPDYLDVLAGRTGDTQLVVMVHAADVEPGDLRALGQHQVSLVRLAARPDDVVELGRYADAAHAAGLQVSVNLIRVSELEPDTVLRTAEAATSVVGADMFYIADSNGSMFPEDVAALARRLRDVTPVALGFHAHDSISLAFSNTLAALAHGFRYVDASLAGMGKGRGNLSLELITTYLRSRTALDFRVAPLARTSAEALRAWKGDRVMADCRLMVAGMLDLNMDTLAALDRDDPLGVFSMLDRWPSEQPEAVITP